MAEVRQESGPPEQDAAVERLDHEQTAWALERQADLAYVPALDRHVPARGSAAFTSADNADIWSHFFAEQEIYDTRRVTLDGFHLFDWFPLAPGQFHRPGAAEQRAEAARMAVRPAAGGSYLPPEGKAAMLRGGVGAVRLLPRRLDGEDYYFMTASSTGVCHEGFPVLVPRSVYARHIARIAHEGAAPVTLSGEMRWIPPDAVPFFQSQRHIPLLYLRVDQDEPLAYPRAGVTAYRVSVAVAFRAAGEWGDHVYATYAGFDPAASGALERACAWIENFYVNELFMGDVLTDFDERVERFPGATFGLADALRGRLDRGQVDRVVEALGLSSARNANYFVNVERFYAGDRIRVGDIKDSPNIAIGREATAGPPRAADAAPHTPTEA